MPDLCCGPVLVIRHKLHHDRNPARAVALIGELLIRYTCQFTGTFFNGSFNIFLGHIIRFSSSHGRPEAWIRIRITSAHPCGNCQLLNQSCKYLTPLGISSTLFSFNCTPF